MSGGYLPASRTAGSIAGSAMLGVADVTAGRLVVVVVVAAGVTLGVRATGRPAAAAGARLRTASPGG
jgi:hypothetical protein